MSLGCVACGDRDDGLLVAFPAGVDLLADQFCADMLSVMPRGICRYE
jgi:hypothetical protein